KGPAAAARRRSDRGSGGRLFRSQQLRETLGPPRLAACQGTSGRCDLGQSVRQYRQSPGALRNNRARDLGATEGEGDGFTCAVGPGGTLAGAGWALKPKTPNIKTALPDPLGPALYSYYTSGELKSPGPSITEGIGKTRITANLEDAPVDLAYQISDEEALPIV